jgi:hypothetical protein
MKGKKKGKKKVAKGAAPEPEDEYFADGPK